MENAKVLLVDDEPLALHSLQVALRREPFDFETACSAERALELLDRRVFDVVVSDECMPGMHGAELLERVLHRSPETVRILLTGQASLEAATRAVNLARVDRFLLKPCPAEELALVIRAALDTRRRARTDANWTAPESREARSELVARFERALASLRPIFQPIFDRARRQAFAFEALVRADPTCFTSPVDLLGAAHGLDRSNELNRVLRGRIADAIDGWGSDARFFVNVEPGVLLDDELYGSGDPLRRHAVRTVLEITERGSLDAVPNLDERLGRLRALGYRFAIDDVGAGYAGLNSLALIDPEFVKIDREIVSGIAESATKQRIAETIIGLCHRTGAKSIAEGIETVDELDAVDGLDCDLLQGYHLCVPLEFDDARKVRAPRT
ncbi:MAG: EAL domain-containing protein [Planctomycetes bacterium]|nr:EAL domain-containing protein [Planctomycetota bacterium]